VVVRLDDVDNGVAIFEVVNTGLLNFFFAESYGTDISITTRNRLSSLKRLGINSKITKRIALQCLVQSYRRFLVTHEITGFIRYNTL
jgi:hypothetical protein